MGFSIGSAIKGALGGFASGGPAGALAGGLAGGFSESGAKSGPGAPPIDTQVQDQARMITGKMQATMAGAKAYGIHPTVALGMPASNGAVYSIGGGSSGDTGAAHDMGQSIGAATYRAMNPEDRTTQALITKQSVERGELENELLKTQIAQIRSSISPAISTSNKGQMIAGQADTGIDYINNQLVKHENSSGKESGTPSAWTDIKTPFGSMRVPSKDAQDRMEDIPLIGYEWLFKNKIMPSLLEGSLGSYSRYIDRTAGLLFNRKPRR